MDSAEIVQDTEDEGDRISRVIVKIRRCILIVVLKIRRRKGQKEWLLMIPYSRRNNPKYLLFFKKKDHIDC